ncbi:MAG: DnaB-like helicase C-terminal domain-containing protein [Ignavibacteriota bacterium]
MNYNQTLVEAAKQYLKHGFSVFPVNIKKEPAIGETWKRTLGENEVENLFSESNVTGVGIACGKLSANLEIVDIDSYNGDGGQIWSTYKALLQEQLPTDVFASLVIERSVRGGVHLYYRCETVDGNMKLAMKQKRKHAIPGEPETDDKLTLIETRGEGGYIVASPTTGYVVEQGSLFQIPTITTTDRQTILDLARRFDERELDSTKKIVVPAEFTRSGCFDDYNQNGDVVGLLQTHGWEIEAEKDPRIFFRRPGNTTSKNSGNFHKELRRFYVFSNATDFQSGKGYDPVGVYATLECSGDYSAASKKLSELGYGRGVIEANSKGISESEIGSDNRFASLLTLTSESDLQKRLRSKPGSIPSGYFIQKEPLLLPSGALTVLCAPTSHGKTTAALNIALNVAAAMIVHFFSYEEDADSILISLINIYLGRLLQKPLSANAKRSIKTFLQSGTKQFFDPEYLATDPNAENLQMLIKKFFADYIDNGRIRIHYVPYNSKDLADAIRYLHRIGEAEAIFVDFIQLINPAKGSNPTYSRQEQVKQICIELKDAAVDTGLPIVLTAQFNRSVVNHKLLLPTNIGEAGDIERLANLIVGFLNNNFETQGMAAGEMMDKYTKANTLYVKILKNREGRVGLEDVFTFDGNIGKIANMAEQQQVKSKFGG